MRVTSQPESRFLGYVQVKVASRVYNLPVEAVRLAGANEGPAHREHQPGFFADGTDRFGIVVDMDAPDAEQQATIERASVDAARHISRKVLN
jgi:hypothetical protein